jgi:hypothetical protein
MWKTHNDRCSIWPCGKKVAKGIGFAHPNRILPEEPQRHCMVSSIFFRIVDSIFDFEAF